MHKLLILRYDLKQANHPSTSERSDSDITVGGTDAQAANPPLRSDSESNNNMKHANANRKSSSVSKSSSSRKRKSRKGGVTDASSRPSVTLMKVLKRHHGYKKRNMLYANLCPMEDLY